MKSAGIIVPFFFFLLSACAAPAVRVDRLAAAAGFSQQVVKGGDFSHLTYSNGKQAADSAIHVYLEGDGRPWVDHIMPSGDPTPRNPLMLKLMQQDPNRALYLGRPCYYGLQNETGCSQWFWTFGRYSERVIESMALALEKITQNSPDQELVFLGHSGGAVMAVFLAQRFSNRTRAVVTISGLLDIQQWAEMHGYTPLVDSLNPATEAELDDEIMQLHFSGGDDTNIPSRVNDRYRSRFAQASYVEIPGIGHLQWENKWPDILDTLQHVLSADRLNEK